MGYIESGKRDGAKIALGGKRLGDNGHFIEPTLFVDTTSDMKIVREEIFGPVAVIIKFKDKKGESRVLSTAASSSVRF